jgi:hypothetical protein
MPARSPQTNIGGGQRGVNPRACAAIGLKSDSHHCKVREVRRGGFDPHALPAIELLSFQLDGPLDRPVRLQVTFRDAGFVQRFILFRIQRAHLR